MLSPRAHAHTLEIYGAPGGLTELLHETQSVLGNPWKPAKFAAHATTQHGFVRVTNASWDTACELTARLSSAHDVRLELASGRVQHWPDLQTLLQRCAWQHWLPTASTLEVQAQAFEGVCNHAQKIKRIAENVLHNQGFVCNDPNNTHTQIRIITAGQHARVQIGLGNDALHKRGWRATTSTPATLREDLACTLWLRLRELEPRITNVTRIVVPFAGSGTLGIEAWHALMGLPPSIWGAARPWQTLAHPNAATQHWWQTRTTRAAQNRALPDLHFIENNTVQHAELCANIAHIQNILTAHNIPKPNIQTQHADVFALQTPALIAANTTTLLALHPPYGLRLTSNQDTIAMYAQIGQRINDWAAHARNHNAQIIGFCLCPSTHHWQTLRDQLTTTHHTSHITQGGLDIRVCAFSSLG